MCMKGHGHLAHSGLCFLRRVTTKARSVVSIERGRFGRDTAASCRVQTALHLRLTVRSLSNTGTATMDDRDFECWKVCWKINLFFQGNLTCVQKCIVCEQVEGNGDRVLRSTFWREATTCSAGHYQLQPSDTTAHVPVVCYRCDQTYVFDVVKGKHTCRVQNCRRILRVNNDVVSGKLDPKGSTNFTLEKDPVKLLRYVTGYHSPRR